MLSAHRSRFSRRALLGGAVGTAMGAILAACGSESPTAPTVTTGGTVATAQPQAITGNTAVTAAKANYPSPLPAGTTVNIVFESYNLATVGIGKDGTQQLIDEFNAAHPNIKVEGRAASSTDIITKAQAEVVAGMPPDVLQGVFGDLDFIINDLKANAVEDLVPPDEFTAYTGGPYPLSPNGLKLGALNGKTYGVPYTFSTPTLFYNADLLTAAGLDPAKPPTTWAETKQYALQIKQKTGKEGVIVAGIGPNGEWLYQSLVRSNGGRVLSEDRKTVTFAQPDAVGAVQMVQDLVQSGAHPKLNSADGITAFSGGSVGLYLQSSAIQAALINASTGKWALRAAKMPAFTGKPAVPTNSGSGLFILAKDPLKQRAAWEFMKFVTSEHGYTIITSKIGYLPLRPGIVDDDRYLKAWAEQHPLVQPNIEQLKTLEPWVAFPGSNYRQIVDIETKAVEDVAYNGANAETTLKAAQDRSQQLMPKSSP